MTTRAPRRLDLASYSRGIEAFWRELAEETYANRAGLKDEMALAPIYERHAELFERHAIDSLRERAGGTGDDAAQAALLLRFAVANHVRARVADLTGEIETAESRAIVIWRGERLPYRSVPNRIAEMTGRLERNALESAYLDAVEAINPLREERLRRMRDATVELGYDDPVDAVRQLAGFDPDALAAEMNAFLSESETVYYAALRRYLALIDIEQGDATAADLRHVLRGRGWDHWFDARRAVAVLESTLAGIGIDLAGQSGIMLDVAPRPTKSPRAFCAVVQAPGDVRLVVQPRGGWDDYAALLHEAGHAEHFAHVPAEMPVAFRLLGDATVTEGYAALFEMLFMEPAWLEAQLGMPAEAAAGFGDFAAFWRLYLIRRQAAHLLYELRLLRNPEPTLARAYYAGIVGLLTGVSVAESAYLATVDDDLYAATYLRSWLFEAQLAEWLRRQHDAAWWREPAAGDALRRAWSRGQQWRAEDVVAHLGYDHLDWRPVLRQIRTRLIGEMSGYGGPNITTRAGTRKV